MYPWYRPVKKSNILKRIFCLHLNWVEGIQPDEFSKFWHCTKCGKEKSYNINETPIQYLG